jgi:TatD DNase family protein
VNLVDTHCHIQSIGQKKGESHTQELWNKSDLTPEKVIENANMHGVNKLICVGCDLNDSLLAVDFVQKRDNCFASIGIHPHEAKAFIGQDDKLEQFTSLADKNKVVAVGECGLDYFYNHSEKEDQIAILRFQIELALSRDLPLIFHVRQAFADFWPVFDSYKGIRGVLHSFTDNLDNLNIAIERGLFIGVNGISTFAKTEDQKEVYKSIPMDHLLLETDSPYLTPVPYRGTINEPMRVGVVADFLCYLKHENRESLSSKTTKNAINLFGI